MKRARMKMLVGAGLIVCATVLTFDARGAGEAFDFRRGFSGVAAKATPAVVFIQVEKQVPAGNMQYYFNNPFDLFGEEFSERFFGQQMPRRNMPRRKQPQQMFKQTGQGSGFLISRDGYILTNTHVVGDVDKITVRLSDGREFLAKRIGADPKTEVALIKIETKEELPFLAIGKPATLQIGEWVIAIGNPFGLKETLTVGVVSAKGRSNIGITDYENFIQTDAAINPGNSGGALVDVNGNLMGINTAIYSRSGGSMGIGFAIPVSTAKMVLDGIVKDGQVTRGWIGVEPSELSPELAETFGVKASEGVIITGVLQDGPAAQAGLRPGDVIVSVGEKKIASVPALLSTVAALKPGEKSLFEVQRGTSVVELEITPGLRPAQQRRMQQR